MKRPKSPLLKALRPGRPFFQHCLPSSKACLERGRGQDFFGLLLRRLRYSSKYSLRVSERFPLSSRFPMILLPESCHRFDYTVL